MLACICGYNCDRITFDTLLIGQTEKTSTHTVYASIIILARNVKVYNLMELLFWEFGSRGARSRIYIIMHSSHIYSSLQLIYLVRAFPVRELEPDAQRWMGCQYVHRLCDKKISTTVRTRVGEDRIL